MIKTIFCLSVLFVAAFLGFADPEAAAPVQKTVSESKDDKDSVYAIPFYYSDKDSFYTLLGGWKNKSFFYAGGPLFCGIRMPDKKNENNYTYLYTYLCFLGGSGHSGQTGYLFPLYLYTKDSNEFILFTLLMGTYSNNEVFYFLPPLYTFSAWPKRSGTKPLDYYYGYQSLLHHRGYCDSAFLWPFGRLRIVDEPSENTPKIQGQFFPLFGYYKDDLISMNWLGWPLYFYLKENCIEDDGSPEKTTKKKLDLSFEMLMSFPFYIYMNDNSEKETYRNFILLAGTYDGKDHSSFYILPFYSFSGKGENNERGFSFAWRLFNIKNDDDGLKRLDILFIPFYSKGKNKDDK